MHSQPAGAWDRDLEDGAAAFDLKSPRFESCNGRRVDDAAVFLAAAAELATTDPYVFVFHVGLRNRNLSMVTGYVLRTLALLIAMKSVAKLCKRGANNFLIQTSQKVQHNVIV